MQNKKQPVLLVLGSLNLDLVLNVARMPEGGETLASDHSATFCGGKGANQAVACARMGAPVFMIGRVGDDPAASMLRTGLDQEGVDLDGVMTTPDCASGIAVVMLTPDGENRIVLAAGANAKLCPADVAATGAAFDRAGMLVCQLETPLETIIAAAAAAASRNIPVLLNPAPARALPADLLDKVDYLVPNELEAATLTGIAVRDDASAQQAARASWPAALVAPFLPAGRRALPLPMHKDAGICPPCQPMLLTRRPPVTASLAALQRAFSMGSVLMMRPVRGLASPGCASAGLERKPRYPIGANCEAAFVCRAI